MRLASLPQQFDSSLETFLLSTIQQLKVCVPTYFRSSILERSQTKDSYRKYLQIDGGECIVDVLDTAGCSDGWSYGRDDMKRDAHGVMLIFAVDSFPSWEQVKREWLTISRIFDVDFGECGNDIYPAMIVANKCDLPESQWVFDDDFEEMKSFADDHNMQFWMHSAKDGTNNHKIFEFCFI